MSKDFCCKNLDFMQYAYFLAESSLRLYTLRLPTKWLAEYIGYSM